SSPPINSTRTHKQEKRRIRRLIRQLKKADEARMSEGGDQSTVPAATATMDVQMALRAVLKSARFADGLTKGFREAAKALDKRECHFAVLAENCEDPMAVMLVEALCKKHQIPMMKVADKKLLGEWCGL
ncbi:hypothetical protein PENTCL1PPCAC_1455, partial [Pristionchus entomophagus]